MAEATLPEGTDTIVDDDGVEAAPDFADAVPMDSGAEALAEAEGRPHGTPAVEVDAASAGGGGAGDPASLKDVAQDAAGKAQAKAADLKGQAAEKMRAYATTGKDKASETLSGVAKMMEDAAQQIDEKVGGQYGGYARQAAQTLAGFASQIDEKDVDALFEQARDAVRKSPAIAIGAAAAIGFVLTRLVKAGVDATTTGADERA